jgi:hypothetical protein
MTKHTEVQHAPKAALRLVGGILIAVYSFLVLLFTVLVIGGVDEPWHAALLMIGMGALFVTLVFVMRMSRMYVTLSTDGVHVRYVPFHVKGRFIPWADVKTARLRPIRALGEFGGWGIRWTFGNKIGYIWDGTTALELRLHNGRTVVITLTQPEAAEPFLDMRSA